MYTEAFRSILMRYNNLSTYFREKYGKRVKKICIDGGFSCPNRDGRCGHGGCIYCGERGAGEHIDHTVSIRDQVERELKRGADDDVFLAYFQNFTNTYADVDTLRKRYDAALIDERIKLISIGTRPDCIDEEIAELIAEYQKTHEVWVELGLQTANDRTADIINRGYHREAFERAMDILKRHKIPVVVHLIVGLPEEGIQEIIETAKYLRGFDIFGIKIHSIYVMDGTTLAEMYKRGDYTPPTLQEYIEGATYLITHINPKTVIHRITGDCPENMLLAPQWNRDKNAVIKAVQDELEQKNLTQGMYYYS
jgi:radical SAM protein (TIGR01212 family)